MLCILEIQVAKHGWIRLVEPMHVHPNLAQLVISEELHNRAWLSMANTQAVGLEFTVS